MCVSVTVVRTRYGLGMHQYGVGMHQVHGVNVREGGGGREGEGVGGV